MFSRIHLVIGALALAPAVACGELPPTVDFVEGRYSNQLVEGDLAGSVEVFDNRSTVTLDFYLVRGLYEQEIWLDLELDGDLELIGGAPVDGLEIITFDDVYIADGRFKARGELDGVRLNASGTFLDDDTAVDASVRFLGDHVLELEPPAQVELQTVGR